MSDVGDSPETADVATKMIHTLANEGDMSTPRVCSLLGLTGPPPSVYGNKTQPPAFPSSPAGVAIIAELDKDTVLGYVAEQLCSKVENVDSAYLPPMGSTYLPPMGLFEPWEREEQTHVLQLDGAIHLQWFHVLFLNALCEQEDGERADGDEGEGGEGESSSSFSKQDFRQLVEDSPWCEWDFELPVWEKGMWRRSTREGEETPWQRFYGMLDTSNISFAALQELQVVAEAAIKRGTLCWCRKRRCRHVKKRRSRKTRTRSRREGSSASVSAQSASSSAQRRQKSKASEAKDESKKAAASRSDETPRKRTSKKDKTSRKSKSKESKPQKTKSKKAKSKKPKSRSKGSKGKGSNGKGSKGKGSKGKGGKGKGKGKGKR